MLTLCPSTNFVNDHQNGGLHGLINKILRKNVLPIFPLEPSVLVDTGIELANHTTWKAIGCEESLRIRKGYDILLAFTGAYINADLVSVSGSLINSTI